LVIRLQNAWRDEEVSAGEGDHIAFDARAPEAVWATKPCQSGKNAGCAILLPVFE